MKTRSLLMALALASCASFVTARDICHWKGCADPGGPGGAGYSGPGGTGDDCPSLCR